MASPVVQFGQGIRSFNPRGGGGEAPRAKKQAQALATPPPIEADTPVNPMQKTAFDAAQNYESGLAKGTNEEITRELQRARDEISVGVKGEGEAAMGRGATPGFFKSRAMAEGARNLNALQGKLADVALEKRAGALDRLTTAAGSAAGEQRLMHLGTLASRLDAQRELDERADLQARLNDAPYRRLLDMLSQVKGFMGGTGGLLAPAGGTGLGTGGYKPPAGYTGPTWSRGSGLG